MTLNTTTATSKKSDGNMSFVCGDSDGVLKNRQKFLNKNAIDLNNAVIARMEHGDRMEVITRANKGGGIFDYDSGILCDAMVTNEKDLALMIHCADCFPVTFGDPSNGVIGIAHMGWRPTAKKIGQKVLDKMKSEFGSNPADICVNIGPGIRAESYIFESEPEQNKIAEWRPFVKKLVDDKFSIDLPGFIKKQLLDAGVRKENISDEGIDTATSDEYFSHYRSERTGEEEGRFLCAIILK